MRVAATMTANEAVTIAMAVPLRLLRQGRLNGCSVTALPIIQIAPRHVRPGLLRSGAEIRAIVQDSIETTMGWPVSDRA